jgi:hypothetical protein
VIRQNYRVIYREAHTLLEELADATLDGNRKKHLAELGSADLLIIDDLGMRKLPQTAAEDLLELIMRRNERASTLITSNLPVEDWGKVLGDAAAVGAMLDRLPHHAHVLKCGPRSWLHLATPKGPPSARIMGPAEAPATCLPMPPRTPRVEPGGLRQEADVLRFERPIFRALVIGALGGGPESSTFGFWRVRYDSPSTTKSNAALRKRSTALWASSASSKAASHSDVSRLLVTMVDARPFRSTKSW